MNKRVYKAPVLDIYVMTHPADILDASPGLSISERAAGNEDEVLSRDYFE